MFIRCWSRPSEEKYEGNDEGEIRSACSGEAGEERRDSSVSLPHRGGGVGIGEVSWEDIQFSQARGRRVARKVGTVLQNPHPR